MSGKRTYTNRDGTCTKPVICREAEQDASKEGPARKEEDNRSDCRVNSHSLQQADSARDQKQRQDQRRRDDREYLFDSALARTDPCDVLGYPSSAIRAYTATLDNEIGLAVGALNPAPDGHRRC
jgi:hypothetical protein